MKAHALFLMMCLTLPLAAGAQTPSGVDDLEGLLDVNVVSGTSRAQERADDAPATVTVVTADDLRRYGLRSLNEAINFLSVSMVAQDPLHAVEVGSRGVLFTGDFGNHLLVVVDGHVMNEPWNGTAYFEQGLGVPLEFIDHLELIVGPGSVLYGSNAMLGVINVVTKRPRDLGAVQLTLEGSALPPQGLDGAPQLRWPDFGGTGRVSLMAGHELVLGGQPLEVSLAAEYYAHHGQSLTFAVQDGLTQSDGQRTWPTPFGPRAPGPGSWGGTTTDAWWTQETSALLKVRWGDFSFWARGALYARGSPASEFGVTGNFDGLTTERDRWLDLELRWSRMVTPRLQLSARLYIDLYDYLMAYDSSNWLSYGSGNPLPNAGDPADFSFRTEPRGESRWGGVEVQGVYDWLGDGRFPLMGGVDARRNHFSAENTYSAGGTTFDRSNSYQANEWQLGVYLQQRARLPASLQLNVGARLDLQAAFPPRISPRAALVWTAPWEGRFKLVGNTAFRAPSGYERFSEFPGAQIKASALRPESVLSGELGYEQRVGRHRLAAGAFVSSFTDMVRYAAVPEGLGADGQAWFVNGGSLLNVGGYALIDGSSGRLSYAASLTGAVNSSDEALAASPSWFGNARLSWDFGPGLPRASLAGAFTGSQRITAASATGIDATGASLSWDAASQRVGPQVQLRAAVDAKVKAVPGLWLRGVVGGALMPFSAYTVGPRQAPEPGYTTPAQTPNSRLFVMLTVGWSLENP